MSRSEKKISLISELVYLIDRKDIPIVSHDDRLEKIIEAFAMASHSRLVYVIDDSEKLLGVISLGNLARHLLFYDKKDGVDNLHLTNMAFAETAKDFMDGPPYSVDLDDNVDKVIEKMINQNIKEIPVIDKQQKIVADITLVDLLKHCKHYFLNNE